MERLGMNGTIQRSIRCRTPVAVVTLVGLSVILGLAGCEPAIAGPMLESDGAALIVLAPIPRGAETPTYPVDRAHAWRLESPARTEGTETTHPGSALVTFAQIAVELNLQAGKARLRCVRPRNATTLQPLMICTFAGEVLGLLEIDHEVTLDGFLGRRARLQFDLNGGAPGSARPRMLIDPLPVLKILNHSPRGLQWTDLRGQKVVIPPLDRAEMVLAETLENLHISEIEPRALREGQLYSIAAGKPPATGAKEPSPQPDSQGIYFARSTNDRLMILTDNPRTPLAIPVGDQTAIVAPPPGARLEIAGRWRLEAATSGGWVVRLAISPNGSYPVLYNPSGVTVAWRNQVTAVDIELPAHTWRNLQPLP